MNPAQKKAIQYANTVNDAVQNTQEVQEKMHPQFEVIKKAIDENTLKDMLSSKYLEIQGDFQQGTDEYKKIAKVMHEAKAPARLMGTHHNLANVYDEYAQSCQDMVDSMKDNRDVDIEAFTIAEKKQEEATDKISKYITKIFQG
ncbi:hypothetical protein RD055328_10690 [Companilactobacillus sp. RD055328]|uniref:hypothetical protein n=1 Tax=Companilactobacillus sp. RD055328 TaxID=2916634 RepID=UPI001FC7F8EF|nr:hypothetical protein [Companilactobacillus sp. RD055328]GKQ43146.1 hypothetical protein RD055328_10690 [Companilactobacillus sp. RD055328]